MSDSRKDKELILPTPVNNESDGLRVKEAVANKEKEASSAASASSASSSSTSTMLTESTSSTTLSTTTTTTTTTVSSATLESSMEDEDSATGSSSAEAVLASAARASPKKTPKKSLTKCTFCNKKTGLNGFVCRCGDNFCALHRLPEKHACTFDFQSRGKESIQRDNPLVQRSKVSAI